MKYNSNNKLKKILSLEADAEAQDMISEIVIENEKVQKELNLCKKELNDIKNSSKIESMKLKEEIERLKVEIQNKTNNGVNTMDIRNINEEIRRLNNEIIDYKKALQILQNRLINAQLEHRYDINISRYEKENNNKKADDIETEKKKIENELDKCKSELKLNKYKLKVSKKRSKKRSKH